MKPLWFDLSGRLGVIKEDAYVLGGDGICVVATMYCKKNKPPEFVPGA